MPDPAGSAQQNLEAHEAQVSTLAVPLTSPGSPGQVTKPLGTWFPQLSGHGEHLGEKAPGTGQGCPSSPNSIQHTGRGGGAAHLSAPHLLTSHSLSSKPFLTSHGGLTSQEDRKILTSEHLLTGSLCLTTLLPHPSDGLLLSQTSAPVTSVKSSPMPPRKAQLTCRPSSSCVPGDVPAPLVASASPPVTESQTTSPSRALRMSLVTRSTAEGEDLQVHPEFLGDCEGARLYLVLPRRAGQGQFKRPEPYPQKTPIAEQTQ